MQLGGNANCVCGGTSVHLSLGNAIVPRVEPIPKIGLMPNDIDLKSARNNLI